MSGVSTNTPVPSKLLFLHEVAKEPIGTKVRFLCCVLDYEVSKAFLHVEHRYPHDAEIDLSTAVEITQVLGTIKSTELQAGRWLNVIGYVRRSQSNRPKRKRTAETVALIRPQIIVQAILIWDAGGIKIADYERTLMQQHEARKLAVATLAKASISSSV